MKIIAWLWNPWLEYKQTRHNIGFIFLDYLKDNYSFSEFTDSKFKWLISEWNISWEKVILIKPMTYMNLSWESISAIMNFYKLDHKSDLIVVIDDISMNFWKVRYRDKWSAWWHNGLKSIIWAFWSEEFSRIKIWVWLDSRYDVSDWVLSKFTGDEIQKINTEAFIEVNMLLKEKFIS